MEKETADREPLSSFSPERPFTERLFESFVGDISSTVGSYHVGQLDAEAFVKRLRGLVKGLEAFTKNGSVEQVLSRAEMVILDGVCRDISAAAEGDVTGPEPVIATEPERRASAVIPTEVSSPGRTNEAEESGMRREKGTCDDQISRLAPLARNDKRGAPLARNDNRK